MNRHIGDRVGGRASLEFIANVVVDGEADGISIGSPLPIQAFEIPPVNSLEFCIPARLQ